MMQSWDPRDVRHPSRASWDEYFVSLARAAATRASCTRRREGAIIVHARQVIATGFNGAPAGHAHCDEGACAHTHVDSAQPDPNCIAVPAAANALLFSNPRDREGGTLYATHAPDFSTARLIANSGIAELVLAGGLYDEFGAIRGYLLESGVRVRVLHSDTVAVIDTPDAGRLPLAPTTA